MISCCSECLSRNSRKGSYCVDIPKKYLQSYKEGC
uniref:Uncharacterized protein n=1 Tax=Arundo donax TaxID=35708 RepID=A0A0A8Y192_ARUDO